MIRINYLDLMFRKLDTKQVNDQFCGHKMPERSAPTLPLPVLRALRKLGSDIKDARLRRRIPTTTMAERASISRTTLNNLEKGDPGVALGIYATVLFILGLTERLAEIADVKFDTTGRELDEERLPQRIRTTTRRRKAE